MSVDVQREINKFYLEGAGKCVVKGDLNHLVILFRLAARDRLFTDFLKTAD